MRASLPASLLGLVALSSAQTWPFNIVGTWSTKSNKTLTGPGFYDPVNENLIEPERTGISYSFTGDGHYEEAYYRAISNPANPACPLTPIAIDGRQLLSEPCKGGNSVYTRYNQTELFERYEYLIDPYHNIPRLNLFRFDGSPLNPMYLVMSPPMMLPTTTLHPPSATATAGSKNSKRGLDAEVPINWKSKLEGSEGAQVVRYVNAERLWWVGLAMTGVGGLLYVGPRRMGVTL
ncbi:hypothetical protein B0A48_12165 [Cryoendolithus antarcticus]|uniref:Protein ROT1 n=1 Tax=Cryoendolithus antarcticus TaxID=1507870 RepID=A0A1V8STX3_9PEZI|nr:hypothetical protein B0A48_12165 [Cryoendolithus antarcticus]